jgi:hypothetical protein
MSDKELADAIEAALTKLPVGTGTMIPVGEAEWLNIIAALRRSEREPPLDEDGFLRQDLEAVRDKVYNRLFFALKERGIMLPGCDTTDKALEVIEKFCIEQMREPPGGMAEHSCWLIERMGNSGFAEYWTGEHSLSFDRDSYKAVRFPTDIAAMTIYSSGTGKFYRDAHAVGHLFLAEREPSGEILDAAVELSAFCKSHDYPDKGSADFNELTRLVDRQDSAIRKWKRAMLAASESKPK